MENVIRSGINEKYIDSDGILRIKVLEGAHIDVESLKADGEINIQLAGNRKVLALYDSRGFFTIEPEAREYLRSGIVDPTRIATAVLTDRLATKLLVNFFIRFNKPKTPMKMFTSEQQALSWLKSFETEN
ncbi:MAG: hypothetical protein JNL60_05285 [Bacteroidia bacterium]|nr:hypothetical protein [Bacteroidia bacterium]